MSTEQAVPCTRVKLELSLEGNQGDASVLCTSHPLPKLLQQPVPGEQRAPPSWNSKPASGLHLSLSEPLAHAEICQALCKSPVLTARGQAWMGRGAEQAGSLPTSLRVGVNPSLAPPQGCADALPLGACVRLFLCSSSVS